MQAKEKQNELESPTWAVISHDRVMATNLKHAEAVDLIDKLQGTKDTGLCVVTAAVATRINGSPETENE